MQESIRKLINSVPHLDEIEKILLCENEAKFILKKALEVVQLNPLENEILCDEVEEAAFLVQALVDKCWERIHTGHFSEVSIQIRQIYSLGCYLKVS